MTETRPWLARSGSLWRGLFLVVVGMVVWWPLAWWLGSVPVKHAHVGLDSIAGQREAVVEGCPLPTWASWPPLGITVALATCWGAALARNPGGACRWVLGALFASVLALQVLLRTDVLRMGVYLVD